MKLIDKDELLNRLEELKQNLSQSPIVLLKDIKSLVEDLEVKEVDLKKEIYDAEKRFGDIDEMGGYRILLFDDEFRDVLRYFYELGLKAEKGE